jgi:hypothetical protein
MQEKVFVTKKATIGDNRYEPGFVYSVDKDIKELLISGGNAEEVNFPRLDAIELAIARTVDEFKQNKKRLETAKQYADAESLRQYEIEKLEQKLDEDVAKLKSDYMLELEAMQKELAEKALQVSYQQDANTVDFINMAIVQLSYSENVVDSLELLAVKVNAMTDDQKLTVLSKFAELKQAVDKYANGNEDAKRVLDEIYKSVKSANKTAEIDGKLRQLQAIKKYYAQGVDAPYRIYKFAKGER